MLSKQCAQSPLLDETVPTKCTNKCKSNTPKEETELYALTLTFNVKKHNWNTHQYVFEILQFVLKLQINHTVKGNIELTQQGIPHGHFEVETSNKNKYLSTLNSWRQRNGFLDNKVIKNREKWLNYIMKDSFLQDVYELNIKLITKDNIFLIRDRVMNQDDQEQRVQRNIDNHNDKTRRFTIDDYM